MGSYLEWFRSCSRITVTSHPSIAVPAGFTDDGQPVRVAVNILPGDRHAIVWERERPAATP